MECVICNKNIKNVHSLQTHLSRHTKSDLIKVFSAQFKVNKLSLSDIKTEVNDEATNNSSVDSMCENSFNQDFKDNISNNDPQSLNVKTELVELDSEDIKINEINKFQENVCADFKDNISNNDSQSLNVKTELVELDAEDIKTNETNKIQENVCVDRNNNNNNDNLNICMECSPKKKKRGRISNKGSELIRRKHKNNKHMTITPIRRSRRINYNLQTCSPLSNQNIYLTPRRNDNVSNYYIPDFTKIMGLKKDDLENLENVDLDAFKKDSPNCLEPLLKTPKVERALKSPSSDTESCSGTVYSVDDQIYCVYCGNGYKTAEFLESHLLKHLNFCIICNIDFNTLSSYIEHLHSHTHKIYICQYCNAEYRSKDILNLHLKHHLEDNLINDILTLETDFKTDRSQINQFYGYYNAGYEFARSSADITNNGSHFYKTFLQMNINRSTNFYNHYYCKICLRNFTDWSVYSDHVRNVHF